jgi:hypothetical protein
MTRLLLLLTGLAILHAQEFRGTLSGRVVDSQEAVIAGVAVVAVNVETGSKNETRSGADGSYSLPFLTPGTFLLTAEAPGFKAYRRDGVLIGTNARVAIDIRLEIGQIAETVTVHAETPLLNTSTAALGQAIDQRQVENMPMNGRSPLALAQLAYGVTPNSDLRQARPYDDSRQSDFSIGGAPSTRNELLLDGSPDPTASGTIAFSPPVDAVTEVKVELFQADAAYGHTGGGTVNMVTRSGTNSLHGSAYDFNQVSLLAANQFFTNKAGQPRPVTRYNQWGVTAGAPVMLPRVLDGRNKLFFFFAYEGIRTGLPLPTTLTVPTAAERTGDFSSLLAAGPSYQLYDPLSGVREGTRVRRTPFEGNVIPTNRIDPIARKILGYYGLPNQAGRADGGANFLSNQVTKDTFSSYLGRLDWNASERHKVFFNFRNNDRLLLRDNYFDNIASGTGLNQYNWGTTLDHVWTATSNMVLNTRFSWARNTEFRVITSEGFPFTELGLPPNLAAASQAPAFPVVSISGYTTLGSGSRLKNPNDTFQIFSALTRHTGSHALKLGTDLRMNRFSSVTRSNAAGNFSFGNNWLVGPLDNAAAAPIGQGLASFLLGMPTGGSFDLNAAQTVQASYFAVFVQDDWRACRNLTLNLGVRYERDLPTTERFNRSTSGFDLTTPSPISAAAQAAYARNPIPEVPASQFRTPGGLLFAGPDHRALYETGAAYFSPRLGFAWKPSYSGKTVIRGGAGVFFFPLGRRGIDQTGFSQSTQLVPTLDGYLTPSATIANPFPNGIQQPTGSSLGLATNLGRGVGYTVPQQVNPYSVRWNFGIQRELSSGMVFEIAYLGNHAVHLENNRALNFVPRQYLSTTGVRDQATIDRLTANVTNPFAGLIPDTNLNGSTIQRQQLLVAFPEFSGVTQRSTPEGSSYYHSLQARVERRFSHGFQFLANYVVAKQMERRSRLNDSDLFLEKRVSTEDRPQRFVLSGSWDVPLRGNRLLNGWNLNAMFTWQPGRPLAWPEVIYYGGDIALDARNVDATFDVTRFNRNSRDQLASNIRTFPTTFSSLRSDGENNINLAVVKNTKILEKLNLQYRCEFFNLLNRTSFSAPVLSPTNSSFGTITGQENLSRSVQMALRLVW